MTDPVLAFWLCFQTQGIFLSQSLVLEPKCVSLDLVSESGCTSLVLGSGLKCFTGSGFRVRVLDFMLRGWLVSYLGIVWFHVQLVPLNIVGSAFRAKLFLSLAIFSFMALVWSHGIFPSLALAPGLKSVSLALV